MKLKQEHEVYIKALSTILTAVSILVGVIIFIVGERFALSREYELISQKDNLQYERNLWLQQRDVYMNLSKVLGEIATEIDLNSEISPKSRTDFSSIYWGELILVENEVISNHLTMLKNDLSDFDDGMIDKNKILKRIKLILDECKNDVQNKNN